MAGLRETNKFLTEAEPWKMKGDERAEDRKRVCAGLVGIVKGARGRESVACHVQVSPHLICISRQRTHTPTATQVVRLTLEAVYVLAHFLAPIMPYSATAIFKKLGNPPQPIPTLQASLVNLKTGALLTYFLMLATYV